MKLNLNFSQSGRIDGDGVDDVAHFLIHGVFDPTTLEASWTKAYISLHSVEYHGVYDHKSIVGTWTLEFATGEFRIWPGALDRGEEEAAHADIEEPAELVLV